GGGLLQVPAYRPPAPAPADATSSALHDVLFVSDAEGCSGAQEPDCMSVHNHNDRREAADAAKKAMLEKFKNKAAPAQLGPAEAAARVKAAEEREAKRVEAE